MTAETYQKGLDYLEPLQLQIPSWMKQIKEFGIDTYVPIVQDDMGRFLRMMVQVERPKRILEIGCGISYSTHWMLLSGVDCKITAVDANHERLDYCREILKVSGYESQVELHHLYADEYFQQSQGGFDLIFQDAAKKAYAGMIEECYKNLKVGGLFIVDNIFYNNKVYIPRDKLLTKFRNGVDKLNEFNHIMASHEGFECSFFAISDGVLVARKIR